MTTIKFVLSGDVVDERTVSDFHFESLQRSIPGECLMALFPMKNPENKKLNILNYNDYTCKSVYIVDIDGESKCPVEELSIGWVNSCKRKKSFPINMTLQVR